MVKLRVEREKDDGECSTFNVHQLIIFMFQFYVLRRIESER